MSAHLDISAWRKLERARLLQARMDIPVDDRNRMVDRIAHRLAEILGDPAGLVISSYWPFRGEPDLKPLLKMLRGRGATTALPVVVRKGEPLVFRAWRSGDKLSRGVWNIPFPAEGPEVRPDVVIAPVVGFDQACYRLGYGGGFFDRTLGALNCEPRFLGVGYAQQEIPTIFPQPYDIPMQAVITESEVRLPR